MEAIFQTGHHTMRVLIIVLWVLWLAACSQPQRPEVDAKHCASRSWSGWAYVDGVGDFPLRIRETADGGSLDVGFAKIYGLALADFAYADQALQFTWLANNGDPRVFTGQEAWDRVAGHIDWAGQSGTFTVHCAALPIIAEDSEVAGVKLGWYLFQDPQYPARSEVWDVRRAGYGEVTIRDVRDGQQRIAFPTDNGLFFTGQSLNDPSVMEQSFTMQDQNLLLQSTNRPVGQHHQTVGRPMALQQQEQVIDSAAGPIRVLVTERNLNPLGIGLVLVPGSGWEVAEDEAFRTENLAALGLTVVTFDKRGSGQTPGEALRPFQATADDVLAVTQWAQQSQNSVTTWGVLGISRGGWMVPKIEGLNRLYDYLVLSVSPAVTPFQQEMQARLTELAEMGLSTDQLAATESYYQALVTYARNPNENHWLAYLDAHRQVIDFVPESYLGAESEAAEDWVWWRLNGDDDPLPQLCQIETPTQVILGLEDSKINFDETTNKLLSCNHQRETPFLYIHPMPGVGHDLALTNNGPMWAFDGLGSEGLDEIWQWALLHRNRRLDSTEPTTHQ